MKHFFLFMLCLWLPLCVLKSQSLSSDVIGSAGEISQGTDISLEWTLGELAGSTITYAKGMITEGFHQPVLKVEFPVADDLPESLQELTQSNVMDWKVFPNPVSSLLNITLESDEVINGSFELYSAQGAFIRNQAIDDKQQSTQFDVVDLPGGQYYLTLRNNKGEILKIAKILKSH